jgi:hypothetical protein
MGFERPQNRANLPTSPALAGLSPSFAMPRKVALGLGVVPKATPIDFPPPALREIETKRAVRLADLHTNLHCSIVGTCLTTGELRQFVGKLDIADPKTLSEHDLHKYGVTIAGQKDPHGPSLGSKLLHKLLDKKHRITLNQFAKARTEAEVGALWDEAVKRGEIPGAYWAVMSHSFTSEALVKRVFGQVHMLSHLVGAANRADIRRLADLEAENAELREKADRQQVQIRDAVTKRDAKIRDLEGLLVQTLTQAVSLAGHEASETDTMAALAANLERRLSSEAGHRARLEERLKTAETRLAEAQKARAEAERQHAELAAELAAAEALAKADGTSAETMPQLGGRTLLYVGGQTGHVANLRDIATRSGAKLVHHDGGIEDRNPLLAGLISQADIVLFPVDCVSHDAMQTVKRLSRQAAKPYVPLRSAGLGSFLAALAALAQQTPEPQPAF